MATQKIGFYNNKGGVGKTTSVINVTYFLQKSGKRVLVVDCDSQENSFSFFSIGNVIPKARPSKYENVFYTKWEFYRDDSEPADYDYIIFDLPPTMTDEVRGIIHQCDVVYVPTALGAFEASGLSKVTNEIHKQGTVLGGVLVTMYTSKRDSKVLDDFKKILQHDILGTVIPYSETVRESQKLGLSLEEYFVNRKIPKNKNSWKISLSYEELTNEIIRRTQQ